MSSYTIKDNSKEVLEAMEKAIDRGLRSIGAEAAGNAQETARNKGVADTGLLINSITYALSGEQSDISTYTADREDKNGVLQSGSYEGTAPKDSQPSVYIGTNVKYAVYNELGTRKMPPRPFLKPAAAEHAEEYRNLMKSSLENA